MCAFKGSTGQWGPYLLIGCEQNKTLSDGGVVALYIFYYYYFEAKTSQFCVSPQMESVGERNEFHYSNPTQQQEVAAIWVFPLLYTWCKFNKGTARPKMDRWICNLKWSSNNKKRNEKQAAQKLWWWWWWLSPFSSCYCRRRRRRRRRTTG